jgi:hypothetical protein
MAHDPTDPCRGEPAALPPPAADDIDVLLEAVCAGGRGPVDREAAPRHAIGRTPAHGSLGASGLLLGRVVGRWIAPPVLAFSVGIATAMWGLQTPDQTSPSLATASAPTMNAPVALHSLFTLRWAEMRAAIERSMIEATLDQIARVADADVDKRASARSTLTREEVQARRAAPGRSLSRELRAAAPAPAPQPLYVGASPLIAEPILSATIAPPPMQAVAADVPARVSSSSSTEIASSDLGTPAPKAETSSPEALAGASSDDEEQAVWRTLTRYAAAFEQMNVGATVAIWPSVDRRELSRAFAALKSQGVVFDACDVDVQRTTATARCSGTVRFVPRVGGSDARVAQQAWLFSMRKTGRDWTIDEVTASRSADSVARARERS